MAHVHTNEALVAQANVIGGVLIGEMGDLDERVYDRVSDLRPEWFSDPAMRATWLAIQASHTKHGDAHPDHVIPILAENPDAIETVLIATRGTSGFGVTPLDAVRFAPAVRRKGLDDVLRETVSLASDALTRGESGLAATHLRAGLDRCTAPTTDAVEPGFTTDAADLAQETLLGEQTRDPRCIDWSVPTFDDVGSYIRPGDMALLAARPASGKTTFVLQLALSVVQRTGGPVLFVSLEMTRKEIIRKAILCRAASRDPGRKDVILTDGERQDIKSASEWLASQPLAIPDRVPSAIDAFCVWLIAMIERVSPGLIVIDYLGLLTGSGSSLYERMSDVSRKVRAVAKNSDVPFLVLHQMNRDIEKDKQRWPQMSDLRDSGQLEQDATHVAFLHHTNPSEEGNRCYVILRKSRNGAVGSCELRPDFTLNRMVVLG